MAVLNLKRPSLDLVDPIQAAEEELNTATAELGRHDEKIAAARAVLAQAIARAGGAGIETYRTGRARDELDELEGAREPMRVRRDHAQAAHLRALEQGLRDDVRELFQKDFALQQQRIANAEAIVPVLDAWGLRGAQTGAFRALIADVIPNPRVLGSGDELRRRDAKALGLL